MQRVRAAVVVVVVVAAAAVAAAAAAARQQPILVTAARQKRARALSRFFSARSPAVRTRAHSRIGLSARLLAY